MASIVVLEDNRIIKNAVSIFLRQKGHAVRQASTPGDAERICSVQSVDLVVADVNLGAGQKTGIEFCLRLVHAKPQVRCVIMSGLPLELWTARDQRNVARMLKSSYTILSKPLLPESLLRAINDHLFKAERVESESAKPPCATYMSDPWLKTMGDLLTSIEGWLRGILDIESWNLYSAKAHLCLEEPKAEIEEGTDGLAQRVNRALPDVEATLSALRQRDRRTSLSSARAALNILIGD